MSEWYKMKANQMGVPFIIAEGNKTIFQCYGDNAEKNTNLALAAPEMLEFIIEMAKRYPNSEWISKEANELIKKATL